MSAARGPSRVRRRSGPVLSGAPRAVAIVLLLGAISIAVSRVATAGGAVRTGPPAYRWALPKGFPKPRTPRANPMSTAKVETGRRLFYDVRLSGNQTQSCASCHQQGLAFTDGRARSVGSTGQVHPRGAPSLVNVAYDATLTWANPALVRLEKQMEVPLFGTRPVELGITDANKRRVLARIRRNPWYAGAFRRAFPGLRRPISWTTIIRSIAAFQRSIVSADSRYDRYLRGQTKLTASEQRGMNLFMGEKTGCSHCHGTFLFSDQATYVGAPDETPRFHNTGLYNVGGTGAFPVDNQGVFSVTGRRPDMGRFKAPSLRNVALTAPYMHDGSIPTLEAAVDHYAAGGRLITDGPLAGDGRANPYKDPLVSGIQLTARDRADLVMFLKSLTDRSLVTNTRFADPFARHTRRRTK